MKNRGKKLTNENGNIVTEEEEEEKKEKTIKWLRRNEFF